jgi:DNA-binding beta-propeller fold protein YncE
MLLQRGVEGDYNETLKYKMPEINFSILSYFVLMLSLPLLFLMVTIITYNDNDLPLSLFAQDQAPVNQTHYFFITKWDSRGNGSGQFNLPHSIDMDFAGNVYVADSGNSRIQKFTSDGLFVTKWGTEGTDDGQFRTLHDVAVSPSGEFVYTIELGNQHRIQKFSPDGQFISKWSYENITGPESYSDPHQIAIDSHDNVYVPDAAGDKVVKFSGNGKFITNWGAKGTAEGEFHKPHGVAIDSTDNVYITDMRNSRIQKFNSNGNFITTWGTEGTNQGQFTEVIPGIDTDYSNDNVYVVDKEGANVQKFSNNGKFIAKWGTKGHGDGQFYEPEDIAINSKNGRVYVTDTGNSRIQIFGLKP